MISKINVSLLLGEEKVKSCSLTKVLIEKYINDNKKIGKQFIGNKINELSNELIYKTAISLLCLELSILDDQNLVVNSLIN